MRKTYQKPVIIIEDFTVNEMVAAGCGAIVKSDSSGWSSDNLLIQEAIAGGLFGTGCEIPYDTLEDGWDGLCYHTQTTQVFQS